MPKTFMRRLEDYIDKEVDAMSAEELRAVIAECKEMPKSVSWVRYGLRDVMLEVAESQLAGIESQQAAK